jgi:redox-sensitive bicupin YhaK (pirin superfamily)
VSNLEVAPTETPCRSAGGSAAVTEFYEARAVPLGGVRGMSVNRLLPQRALPTVGAWCFLDMFGPHAPDMRVLPHPHIGLQTVTWPLTGEIRHRDSIGSDVVLRPGQLNLMTSGRGISHSEFSVGEEPLHGLQLWVALPEASAGMAAEFEQHVSLPVFEHEGLKATVFMGALGDAVSQATIHTPLVGAQIEGTEGTVPLRPDFEYALVLIDGRAEVAGVELAAGPLLYLGTGRTELTFSAPEGARAVLLGGEPFEDELVMWWNFVGRSHDDIVSARADWEASAARFGTIPAHGDDRIPAPELPGLRLKPRKRPL